MRRSKKAIGTVLAAAVLLGTVFGTSAQVSAQTGEAPCTHRDQSVKYVRSEQAGSYNHTVKTTIYGNPATITCTVMQEIEYYQVKCNDCGEVLSEYSFTVEDHSFCQ